MKTNKNQLKEVSQILELEDNKVLIELYGQHDENLTKIENNFGIHISYRGNIIEFRATKMHAHQQVSLFQTYTKN